MTKNTTPKGRRGRPSKRIQDRPFQMRVSDTFLLMIDDWRRSQNDLPSRAEAIRRIVQMFIAKKKHETDA